MIRKFLFTSICVLLLFLLSCSEDKWYQVNSSADAYVEMFTTDAKLNGYDIDIKEKGLILEIKDIDSLIKSEVYYSNPIRIVINHKHWYYLSQDSRQMLVYKDLAQGFLNRLAKNDRLANGEFASIMRDNNDTVFNRNINFSGFRKEYYIKELFNPALDNPWWANYQQDYDSLVYSNQNIIFSTENLENTFNVQHSADLNIQMTSSEIRFDNQSDRPTAIYLSDTLPNDRNFEINCILKINYAYTGEFSGIVWGGGSFFQYYFSGYNPDKRTKIYNRGTIQTYFQNLATNNSYNYQDGYNKITLRKINNRIFYFVNEKFVYFTDITRLYGNHFGYLIGANSSVTINRLDIKY